MNTKSYNSSLLNILLVEDNPGDKIIFQEHLNDSGVEYVLTHCSTLRDALKQCNECQFDVILLDLGLPESKGLETLKRFPLSTIQAPVIVTTGLNDEETALLALKEGAQDYLVKNNLSPETIMRSVRYSIERKKIQEVQKKTTLQFSTLASATAAINEAEDISSVYRVCCDHIKFLLAEQKVYFIEYLDHNNPYTNYYEWLETFFHQEGQVEEINFYEANLKMISRIQDLMMRNLNKKVIEIKGGIDELLVNDYSLNVRERMSELLEADKIVVLRFSKDKNQYGGIFLFHKMPVEPEDVNILEVIAGQASLNINRRVVEKELMLSEQRYRMLNKKLEERVMERTKDLARTNILLEEELGVRVKLEQELIEAKDHLEARVQQRTEELAASEARFHKMFSDHEAIMWLVNPQTGEIIEANPSAKKFYGHSFDALTRIRVQDINLLPEDEIKIRMAEAAKLRNNYFIMPHRLASGEIRTVEVYSSPIDIGNEKLLFSVIHDITERSRMEEALKESESLYKTLVNNSLNLILISVDDRIEFANEAAAAYAKISVSEMMGKSIDELFISSLGKSGDGDSVSRMIYDAVQDNRGIEIRVRNQKGTTFHFLVRGVTIKYKGRNAVMFILTDITESKNVEQFVMNKIIETEENDRKRFAADLHDDLGPLLSAVKLRLGLMENSVKTPELKENVTISNELMGLVIDKVRAISQTIAPNLVENLGLDAAIRDLCRRVLMQNKITFEFESEIGNIRFPQPVELHFYRIISELINNSLKHSEASLIHIELNCINDALKLVYFDNGKGYSLQDSFRKESGIGLRSILNRVNLINGNIDFQKDKGKTVVKVSKKLDPVTSN